MKYLFSPAGMRALEAFSRRRLLCAFDFDGTLAKIVATPDEARVTAATLRRLQTLAEKFPVAVISGRPRRDLASRLPVDGVHFVGNHGLESARTSVRELRRARAAVARMRRQLAAYEWGPDVCIEDKTHSLSVHFRQSPHPAATRRRLVEILRSLQPPPRLIGGKAVVNVIPPASPHKGSALRALMKTSRCARALYIGDDDTDEDVFGEAGLQLLTIRVGRKRASRAQFYLRRQSEMGRLLERLCRSTGRA